MGVLELVICISLFCLGIREITDDIGGRIGYPLKEFLLKKEVPLWILKPTILCVTCMSSFWGTLCYLGFVLIDSGLCCLYQYETYFIWAIVCFSVSFLNTLLWALRNKLLGVL